jgi:hypothetical protein
MPGAGGRSVFLLPACVTVGLATKQKKTHFDLFVSLFPRIASSREELRVPLGIHFASSSACRQAGLEPKRRLHRDCISKPIV